MLDVTPEARACLLARLSRRNAADEFAMRFMRRKNGWKLRLDRVRPDDTIFSHDGKNVLLLDARVSKAMAAMALDASGAGIKAKLKLRRVRNVGE